ncbi:hypothetical protein MTBBW1_580003 [Desulfamplus magnetovallimortis]|uniref:Uncharacterized protein n=1 Tax=Desulfamplus magnetovallimortis TaxID=1246637 RepID=A0A1W1HI13_9BACT|nr:hypothetical protein MTBBW1_580003 [Desulfamplus magnetovallimortis]
MISRHNIILHEIFHRKLKKWLLLPQSQKERLTLFQTEKMTFFQTEEINPSSLSQVI